MLTHIQDETVSLEKQYSAAVSAPYQLSTDQLLPAGGNGAGMASILNISTSTPSSSAASTASTSASSSSASGTNSHRDLTQGAVAGIAIGSVVLALLGAVVFITIGRKLADRRDKAKSGEGPPWSPIAPTSQAGGQTLGPSTGFGTVPSTFVGYNRQTGAPEFVARVSPTAEAKSPYPSPLLSQSPYPTMQHSVELAGDSPIISEAPPDQREGRQS